ncbi:hypothetical protein FSP39_021740 [Pinctada imbricata]|uniref:Uncharacterized protein n=1 Tax=Pinctada imbricata TaxID=66713 RepID=A0AA88YVX4_PINIB|nr:hypothetical protein FSP39_021740 [Pinctada imbricata]
MEENDVDRYIRESSKSYKNCKVKNYARRNSLIRRTHGIEAEHRIAQNEFSREEKQLRKHLKEMQIDKMKHNILHTLREHEFRKKHESDESSGSEAEHPPEVGENRLYPLMYSPAGSPKIRKKLSLEEKGRQFVNRRGRRVSKEYEDLEMDTQTGKLLQPFNVAKRILSARGKSPNLSPLSPRFSPRTGSSRKDPGSPRMRNDNSDGSSPSPISSLEDLHWIGDPEATKSVRRKKMTSEDLMIKSELHRVRRK